MKPKIQAEIAIKAIRSGDLRGLASEYQTSEFAVHLCQVILEKNAEDFFTFISGDDSIFQAMNTFRDQLESIQDLIDEVTEEFKNQLSLLQESLDVIQTFIGE